MADFHRCTRELLWLRRRLAALRAAGFRVLHVHDDNRVLAFQRWVPDVGQDVVVVASLSETTWHGYEIGFPRPGRWAEVFNSDVYDHWVNPQAQGNGGEIHAHGRPLHDLPVSAALTIPANSLLVFSQ